MFQLHGNNLLIFKITFFLGEALLSPLVQCGPKGLRFLKPVELRIPHAGGSRGGRTGRWNVSLKASNEMGQWRQIDLPQHSTSSVDGCDDPRTILEDVNELDDEEEAKNSRHHLSVFVNHF